MALTILLGGPAMAEPPAVTSVSVPRVLLGPRPWGLPYFPDGPLAAAVVAGHSLYFAASGGSRSSPTQGTVALASRLDALTPLVASPTGEPVPSFHPPPTGPAGGFASEYDRDYAGGGPMLWDAESSLLLHAYHAEYHFHPDRPLAFYASIGLAVSRDRGLRFERLGMIVRPERGPEHLVPTPTSVGSFVVVSDQLRLYYNDIGADGLCDGEGSGSLPCLAAAQASLADVIAAAERGDAPVFRKWFRGGFSEPAVGGRFSPLFLTGGKTWVRWPAVARDPAGGVWVLVYAAGATGLELRTSIDGLGWSPPARILPPADSESVNYPSILELARDGSASKGEPLRARIAYVSLARHEGVIDFASRRLLEVTVAITDPRQGRSAASVGPREPDR